MFLTQSEQIRKFLRVLLYVFIALFPFVLYSNYLFDGISTRSINTLILVEISAIVVGFSLFEKSKVASFAKSPITLGLFVLFVSYLFSSFLGVDFEASFWSKATRMTGLLYFSHIAFLYFMVWYVLDTKKNIRNYLHIFSWSTILFIVCTILGQEGLKWMFPNIFWSGFTFGNSTFAGMYVYAGFMVTVYLLTTIPKESRKWWKYLMVVPFFFSPYIVNFDLWRGNVEKISDIVGSSQASAITLFVSVFVLLIGYGVRKIISSETTKKYILIIAVILSLIGVSVASILLVTKDSVVQNTYLSLSTRARPIVWDFSKKSIAERPYFGWGLDNFDKSFQEHYDNTILEKKNGGEAWFDRAHNILIDNLVETGYVGMIAFVLVYIALIYCLSYVVLKSVDRENQTLAFVLLVYFFGHLLELQTAFDNGISYIVIVIFAVISAQLFHETKYHEKKNDGVLYLNTPLKYSLGAVLIVGYLFFFFYSVVPVVRAQNANGQIRKVGSSEKRIVLYPKLFSSSLDKGAFLWGTSNDIQKGVSLDKEIVENKTQREGLKKELEVIVGEYEKYLKSENPDDYRALLNLADIYIYQRLLDVDNLNKAHEVLDHALTLVPQSPQAYWMKSVAYLYQAKFDLAKEWAKKAYDLNPGIEESTRVKEYIDTSVKDFPVIDLYNFKQI